MKIPYLSTPDMPLTAASQAHLPIADIVDDVVLYKDGGGLGIHHTLQAGGTVALARIIFAECFNAAPEFVPLNLDEIDAASVDGIVLTGEAGLAMANPYTLE